MEHFIQEFIRVGHWDLPLWDPQRIRDVLGDIPLSVKRFKSAILNTTLGSQSLRDLCQVLLLPYDPTIWKNSISGQRPKFIINNSWTLPIGEYTYYENSRNFECGWQIFPEYFKINTNSICRWGNPKDETKPKRERKFL